MNIRFERDAARSLRTASILPHHDIVFQSPVCDATYGLPIGDGDTGCLLWLSEEALHIHINKTDLIDNGSDRAPSPDAPNDCTAVVKNGAELVVDFGCPVFDIAYQQSFEGRLRLADARATFENRTPFLNANISAFASRQARAAVVRIEADYKDIAPVTATLRRWGSRTFSSWYCAYQDKPEEGLSGTDALANQDCLRITQHFRGTDFCIAVLPVVEDITPSFRTAGRRTARMELPESEKVCLTLYIAVALGENEQDAAEKAYAQVLSAKETGADALYARHAADWADFWDKSFISLPGEDYLENLWYVNLYYANSAMRGVKPANSFHAVWGFYHDFVPWGRIFHYNGQLCTFPLNAANHPELLETYFRFRRQQLPYALMAGKALHDVEDGAFYADVSDVLGRMDAGTGDNCTCGSQIALYMYQHYRFTGDEKFLAETALPVMRAAAGLYLGMLKREEDGLYHLHGTQAYEGTPLYDDSITDLSMIRSLFAALISVLPEDEAFPYKERLDHLPAFMTADFYADEMENGVFTRGIGQGRRIFDEKVLSVGKLSEDGSIVRRTFGNPANDTYGFPDTEMAPVFPSGLVGIKDKNTALYNRILNSICLHHPQYPLPFGQGCMAWCLMPIYMARMGLDDMLLPFLHDVVNYLIFPQGFAAESHYDEAEKFSHRWHRHTVRNTETGEKSTSLAWPFRHFNYETLPIIAASLNETLIQGYDGTLRLFGALKDHACAAFRLAAMGGWLVNAAYQAGSCDVTVESRQGGTLTLFLDHVTAPATFENADTGEALFPEKKDGAYILETEKGMRVHIVAGQIVSFDADYAPNAACKHLSGVKLGTEKEL